MAVGTSNSIIPRIRKAHRASLNSGKLGGVNLGVDLKSAFLNVCEAMGLTCNHVIYNLLYDWTVKNERELNGNGTANSKTVSKSKRINRRSRRVK